MKLTFLVTVFSLAAALNADATSNRGDGRYLEIQLSGDDEDRQNLESYKQTSDSKAPLTAKVISDTEIQERVRSQLKGNWITKNYELVEVRVSNGDVILLGIVDTTDDKRTIEDKVKKIEGVRSVINQIKARKAAENDRAPTFGNNTTPLLSDTELQKDIQGRLTGSWFSKNYPGVQATVTNGTVVLTGSVDSVQDKKEIEDRLIHVKGVRNLDNQIFVRANQEKATQATPGYNQ